MPLTAPDWLTRHGAALRQLPVGHSWAVSWNDEAQYLLRPMPAAGKFSCVVTQTNNGKHLDSASTYPTAEDALRGGLEDLRKALGW
jgi:hypothetical protein